MTFHFQEVTLLKSREKKCEKLTEFLFEEAVRNNNKKYGNNKLTKAKLFHEQIGNQGSR